MHSMQIFVLMPKGDVITLDVTEDHTIYEVKTAIQERYRGTRRVPMQGFWREDLRLTFAGKQLEDGHMLSQCRVEDQCLVQCELTEEAAAGKGYAWRSARVLNEVMLVLGASSGDAGLGSRVRDEVMR